MPRWTGDWGRQAPVEDRGTEAVSVPQAWHVFWEVLNNTQRPEFLGTREVPPAKCGLHA